MKNKAKKMTALLVVLLSPTFVLLAMEGYQDTGVQEGQDVTNNCPDGGCTTQSWTHYGCVGGTAGSCTPYNSPANPPTVSGQCVAGGCVALS